MTGRVFGTPINTADPMEPAVQWRDIKSLRYDIDGLTKMVNSLSNRVMVLEAQYERLLLAGSENPMERKDV